MRNTYANIRNDLFLLKGFSLFGIRNCIMNKKILAPSLLGANFINLAHDLDIIKEKDINWLHLDIMDGHFVPNISFGSGIVESVKKYLGNSLFLDTHLMVSHPTEYISTFSEIGSNGFTFHYESTVHHDRIIHQIKDKNMLAGISIVPSTSVESLYPILPLLDIVLIMSVNPGFGSQKFIDYTVEKVKKLNKYRQEQNLKFLIEVDGGINSQTLPLMKTAGADIFVTGSAFFSKEEERNKLINLCL